VRDYVSGRTLGKVTGPSARLPVKFQQYLLLEASPQLDGAVCTVAQVRWGALAYDGSLMLHRTGSLLAVTVLLAGCSGAGGAGPTPPGGSGGKGGTGAGQGGTGGGAGRAGAGGTGGGVSSGSTGADATVDVPADAPADSDTDRPAPLDDTRAAEASPPASDAAGQAPLERIAFGSCTYVSASPAFWPRIAARKPQALLFLGDILYLNHGETYAQLSAVKELNELLAVTRPLVIWDDHDYGGNDTGADLGGKAAAKTAFLKYWAAHGALTDDSPRWTREGNYDSAIIGPAGRDVQVIMLDNRWFKGKPPSGTVLGAAQWAWLTEELRKPARLRILMSGMEQISTSSTPEGWGLHPAEQEHLYAVLRETGAKATFIMSGDKHYLEISRRDVGLGYPLYDFTSSPMSAPPEPPEPNTYRDAPGSIISDNNYGFITIDWAVADPTIHVQFFQSYKDTLLLEKKLTLSQLGN
jgi:alkaline phosphatase D